MRSLPIPTEFKRQLFDVSHQNKCFDYVAQYNFSYSQSSGQATVKLLKGSLGQLAAGGNLCVTKMDCSTVLLFASKNNQSQNFYSMCEFRFENHDLYLFEIARSRIKRNKGYAKARAIKAESTI